MYKQTIEEKIRQRRSQMLIHSHIYYEMDDNIVDDHTWQRWADELAELQDKNPDNVRLDFTTKSLKDGTDQAVPFFHYEILG